MTGKGGAAGPAATHSSRHRPRKRATQYSETSVIEPRGRGVLDPPRACAEDDTPPSFRARAKKEARPGMTRVFCPTGKSAKSCPAQVAKIYRFTSHPNQFYRSAVSRSHRGAYHDRHERWRGMRWTLRCRTTNDTDADGKAVWSWRPDAGVKCCGVDPQGDGGKQARSPGRARNKP